MVNRVEGCRKLHILCIMVLGISVVGEQRCSGGLSGARGGGGVQLEEVRHATVPIKVLISGNHQEEIILLVMSSLRVPLVLGRPWMRKHNPQVDWSRGLITGWSP